MGHDMSPDTRDRDIQDSNSNDDEPGIADELKDSPRGSQILFDQAENCRHSAQNANTTGEGMTTPSPDEGRIPRRTRAERPSIFGLPPQPAGRYEGVTTGDSQGYAPSPPFKEAGPTSSVWRAYLDESLIYDIEMFQTRRGELNIILVFAGLFSAIVTSCISQSSANLQPDYQQMSALLLFDQINIQRAIANGTSLDRITSSGTDPTAPFTPKYWDLVINGLWFASLSLSLLTASVAILADEWHCYYLKPIDGDPQARARTRHFRYRGLINSYVITLIDFIPFISCLSLELFFLGLVVYLMPQQKGIALATAITFLIPATVIRRIDIFSLMFPNSPYKTLVSSSCYYLFMSILRNLPKGMRDSLSLLFNIHPELKTVQDFEMFSAGESHIETEVGAIHWLYERSSTLAIHRLVIHALAGLPPNYIAHARKVFSPHWNEIRDEREGMLMDCMTLAQDDCPRWIPKDIPNIYRRIEPLLRLEVLFPVLGRNSPSGHFGKHHMDFSRRLSNTLSITLSSIDDTHIQKPKEQNQVIMDALADNDVHHPLVWKKLIDRYVDKEKLFHDVGDGFTIEMCLNLVTSIYLPQRSPHELYSCTLPYALVTIYKQKILSGLLAFFSTSESYNDLVDPERRLSLAIVRALAPDSAPLTFNSHQRYPFHRDSTISKYRLLCVALHAINEAIHDHPDDDSSKQWRTDAFWVIHSYMTSDLFAESSLGNSEDSELKDLFWTFHADALACMASLMGEGHEDWVVEWKADRAKKPTFMNILQFIHDERVADPPRLPPFGVLPDFHQRLDSITGAVGLLLGQAFKQGIPGAYEAFREKGSLRHIAEEDSLHSELNDGLLGYITGLSDAKAGKIPDIQSDEFPDLHIQDLHQASVIHCICASIARSGTQRHPILSSLVSLDPNHSEWDGILENLKSPTDENSIIKETVEILDECLQAARDGRNIINQPSTSFNPQNGSPETQHRSRLINWTRKPRNRSADVEATGLRDDNDQRK